MIQKDEGTFVRKQCQMPNIFKKYKFKYFFSDYYFVKEFT